MDIKEMDETIKNHIKYTKKHYPDFDENDSNAVKFITSILNIMYNKENEINKFLHRLACEWAKCKKKSINFDYSMIKFGKLYDPNRFGEELITNKKEKK